ncbi:MAG TPA: hypothetical protein VFC68_00545, partial [Treponemataceae bacterium]|nr:hypothetical protein [Treponemataceae bacterium]
MNFIALTKNRSFKFLLSEYWLKTNNTIFFSGSIIDFHYQLKQIKADVIIIDQDYIKIDIENIFKHIHAMYKTTILFYLSGEKIFHPLYIHKYKKNNKKYSTIQKNNPTYIK